MQRLQIDFNSFFLVHIFITMAIFFYTKHAFSAVSSLYGSGCCCFSPVSLSRASDRPRYCKERGRERESPRATPLANLLVISREEGLFL